MGSPKHWLAVCSLLSLAAHAVPTGKLDRTVELPLTSEQQSQVIEELSTAPDASVKLVLTPGQRRILSEAAKQQVSTLTVLNHEALAQGDQWDGAMNIAFLKDGVVLVPVRLLWAERLED